MPAIDTGPVLQWEIGREKRRCLDQNQINFVSEALLALPVPQSCINITTVQSTAAPGGLDHVVPGVAFELLFVASLAARNCWLMRPAGVVQPVSAKELAALAFCFPDLLNNLLSSDLPMLEGLEGLVIQQLKNQSKGQLLKSVSYECITQIGRSSRAGARLDEEASQKQVLRLLHIFDLPAKTSTSKFGDKTAAELHAPPAEVISLFVNLTKSIGFQHAVLAHGPAADESAPRQPLFLNLNQPLTLCRVMLKNLRSVERASAAFDKRWGRRARPAACSLPSSSQTCLNRRATPPSPQLS